MRTSRDGPQLALSEQLGPALQAHRELTMYLFLMQDIVVVSFQVCCRSSGVIRSPWD